MAEITEAKPAAQHGSARTGGDQVLMSEKLCASIGIPAGARVLDIGCNVGHAALHAAIAAARRQAKVTAIHLREPMLERARARAEFEGVAEDIEFMHADAAAMPFADASFDYVVSTLGAVFLPDQEGAAKEMARVLRPGGILALTAFTHQSLPSQVYDMFGRLFPHGPRPQRHHYEWADGPRAGELLKPYFRGVTVQYESFDSCYASAGAAFDATARLNPNIQGLLARSTPEQHEQIRSGFITIADRTNRATDGTFMGPMDYGVITGVRAG